MLHCYTQRLANEFSGVHTSVVPASTSQINNLSGGLLHHLRDAANTGTEVGSFVDVCLHFRVCAALVAQSLVMEWIAIQQGAYVYNLKAAAVIVITWLRGSLVCSETD